jgi:hypothetical protein
MTGDLQNASLPVITLEVTGKTVNELHGCTSERDLSRFRTVITPLSEDRKVTFTVDTYGNTEAGLSFEVRSADGSELIEDGVIDGAQQDGSDRLQASFSLRDLIEKDTEYMLVLIITGTDGTKVRYYTRIVETDTDGAEKELDFAKRFHDAAIAGDGETAIQPYLETDAQETDISYENVSIHSSLSQVTYGTLAPEETVAPVIQIRDLQSETAMLRMEYILTVSGENGTDRYLCTENYRLRNGTDKVHLIDYDRTMRQIFDPSRADSFSDDVISLGINDSTLQMKESDGGSALAFVDAGRLYSCIPSESTVATVFSFGSPDSTDARENDRDYGIRILDVDEAGNINFIVYGYMNRGSHEGEIGTAVYLYSSMYKTVEELAFLPYSGSFELLKAQTEEMSFLNKSNMLYLLIDSTLWQIRLTDRSTTAVAQGLTSGTFRASSSGRMICWKENGKLTLMDCMNMQQKTVSAASGEMVVPLGFIEDDLIYGLARKSDIITDPTGNEVDPMYRVIVCDQDLNILEKYEQSDCYVVSGEVSGSQVNLHRMRKASDGTFTEAEDDQILDSKASGQATNVLTTAPTEDRETVCEIDVRGLNGSSVKSVLPKQVLFEGSRVVTLPEVQEKDTEFYLVYDMYGVAGVFGSPSEAVQLAEERGGNVVDGRNRYIWKKGNRLASNQIMAITAVQDAGEGSFADCLNAIFSLEGEASNAAAKLAGNNMAQAIEETVPGALSLNLTGCSLDAVLYYVSCEKPVTVITDGGNKAVLITGYNDKEVVIMDPEAGTLSKVTREEAEKMLTGTGDSCLAYLVLQ